MNQMDVNVETRIGTMIEDHPTPIPATGQHEIATWATKFALSVESLETHTRTVPDDVYRTFYQTREPFPGYTVQLARYIGSQSYRHSRWSYTVGHTMKPFRDTNVVIVTFAIGRLAIQTSIPGGWSVPITALDGANRITVWPFSLAPVKWPPDDSIPDLHWDAFSRDFHVG
jgi:hypothetical protein